jgi:hypothetical protein
MQDWVRIPYDSTDLFEQLKNVRIKVSGNGLIHYSHKGKTRNDIVVAMCWGLLMLKNLAVTGGFNLSQTLIDMENSPTRKSFEALEWGEISTWLADDLNFGFSGKLIDKNYKDY